MLYEHAFFFREWKRGSKKTIQFDPRVGRISNIYVDIEDNRLLAGSLEKGRNSSYVSYSFLSFFGVILFFSFTINRMISQHVFPPNLQDSWRFVIL